MHTIYRYLCTCIQHVHTVYILTLTNVYIYIYIYEDVCKNKHTLMNLHMYINIHIYTHTHIYTPHALDTQIVSIGVCVFLQKKNIYIHV